MPAVTPSQVRRNNNGSINSIRASFTSVDDGDTWASAIKGIDHAIVVDKTGTTTAGVAITRSGSTFTFKTATNGKAVDLIVYVKS